MESSDGEKETTNLNQKMTDFQISYKIYTIII